MESPIKGEFRLSRVPTTVGGVDLPAGTTVMVVNGAANRDPRRFDDPGEFRVDRPNARQHLAFGHGIHTCAGAPLARAEARVEPGADPRPHGRHHDLGARARPGRRSSLSVRADLPAARADPPPPRVHPGRLSTGPGPKRWEISDGNSRAVRDPRRRRGARGSRATGWPATRFPDQIDDTGWEYGIPVDYLRELVEYWRDEYDWRAQEARLNELDHFRTDDRRPVDPLRPRPLAARGRAAAARSPTVGRARSSSSSTSSRGSPIPRLHGGRRRRCVPRRRPVAARLRVLRTDRAPAAGTSQRIAHAFIELMGRLGYARYGAQGGDWGAQVATRIGALDPEHCAAIHLNMPIADRPEEPVRAHRRRTRPISRRCSSSSARSRRYALEQATKPQTLGVGAQRLARRAARLDRREVPRLERLRRRTRRTASPATSCSPT